MNLPSISVVIPTFNEEENIGQLLKSIFEQEYPKKLIEVLVIDDYSTDDTLKVASKYPIRVIMSGKKHAEVSKMIGFMQAKGDLFIYLDADIELVSKQTFRRLVDPLMRDPNIIASFTKYIITPSAPPIERYLSLDPIQRDPIYQFFSPALDSVIVEKNKNYSVCLYTPDRILPQGCCLYRRKELLAMVKKQDMFLELDFLVLLVEHGYRKFAYVPSVGFIHHHVNSFRELVKKRIYNLNRVYLYRKTRKYTWFNLSKGKDKLKVFVWVIYANLFFPSALSGIYKSLKFRDWAGLYEPVVNMVLTDVLVLNFLRNDRGRALLKGKL